MWEGGREKQASQLAEQTLAKAHDNTPAVLENGSIALIFNFA